MTAVPDQTEPLAPERLAAIHAAMLEWYATSARDLPWRRTRDPYAILVAEVMLQQTQVDRVIPRWHAWLERFPSLAALARATPAEVIQAWQGLGYNLRALRLQRIARQVMADGDGQLPRGVEDLLRLDGIGRYTAGALACFAYERPVAMVDTNIRRVLRRVFGLEHADQALAERVLPQHAAYAWNQALMDLGAGICRADRALCLVCPLRAVCASAGLVVARPRSVPRDAASPPSPPSPPRTPGTPSVRSTRSGTPRRPGQPPFVGSDRYFRGRIVDRVRQLGPDEFVPVEQLVASLKPEPDTAERARFQRLLERLALDGLLSLDPHRGVGPPQDHGPSPSPGHRVGLPQHHGVDGRLSPQPADRRRQRPA